MSLRKIGDYTITRKHGEGGMGTVYQALSPEGATVAVKTMLWPEVVDPHARWEAIRRFQREAHAALSLSHPNICQVLDFGADEDSLYIVMEFLDGDTVGQLIDLAGKIEPERALHIIRDVGEALAHAHDKGIVHRDVKPGNIMVLRNGRVKLTDFGVASVVRETGASRTGGALGTVYYTSPEQVRGEKADVRSDIFSLGATLYEMVTGSRPFQGDTHAAVMHQILNGQPPPVEDASTVRVSHVIERCLQKEPPKRFQSARELIDSLHTAETESALEPTVTVGRARPEPAVRAQRRALRPLRALRRWPVVAAVAATVLIVGALALLRPWARPGDQSGLAEVAPAAPTVVARLPPRLTPRDRGLVATYLYGGMEQIGGIAVKPDGTVLVTVGDGGNVPPGVYVARPGRECDPADAYARPGAPFVFPRGIALDSAGRAVVADSEASVIWVIPEPGERAQVLTNEVPSPCDVVIAPQSFEGPEVHPGDFLVCADSSAGPEAYGLYVVDAATGAVRHLTGLDQGLQNGLLYAEFGPDGTLYAVEDDRNTQDGLTVVTISPAGGVASFVANFKTLGLSGALRAMAGPIAVHPNTGDLLVGYGSAIYRLPRGWKFLDGQEAYAEKGLEITALELGLDGSSLLVGDSGEHVLAQIAPCPIEGTLLLIGARDQPEAPEFFAYSMEGRSDNIVSVSGELWEAVAPRLSESEIAAGRGSMVDEIELSPLRDAMVYVRRTAPWPSADPWRLRSAIWKCDLRGQGNVNLTETAKLGGINCDPVWSPDGRWIAFRHCDPIKGVEPCETGFDIWVMRDDGTEPTPVVAHESKVKPECWWSVNGDRVIYNYGLGVATSRDRDGTDPQKLRTYSGNMSPDGSQVLHNWTKPDVVDGEPGVWRQLCLSNSDGSGERVLVEHFLRDSDLVEYLTRWHGEDPDERQMDDLRWWLGPHRERWSPNGDRIAFSDVLPALDPQGASRMHQSGGWIYELATGILTRLTPDDPSELVAIESWRGPNTYPEDPRVTVGDTTVMFSEVTGEGLTSVIRDDDRPTKPGGYRFAGYYYEIRTTAQYRGPVRIGMKYDDRDATGGREQELAIQRYVDAKSDWEDATTSRDLKNNIVYALVDSL